MLLGSICRTSDGISKEAVEALVGEIMEVAEEEEEGTLPQLLLLQIPFLSKQV